MKSLVIIALPLVLSTYGTAFGQKSSLPSGKWVSENCENFSNPDGSKTYFMRNFDFKGKNWKIHFNTYGDSGCKNQLLNVQVGGKMTQKGPSKNVKGATNTYFSVISRKVKPMGAGVLGWLNDPKSPACNQKNWEVGKTKDIYKNGCAQLGSPSAEACKGEYDLVQLKGDRLFLGQRTKEMCKKNNWPKAIHQVALVKKS